MSLNIPGLVVIVVFYVAILVVGIIAGRKRNKKGTADELFVANRSLGFVVASLTVAASMVGGGFVNGTAESTGRDGLVWTLGPIGYNIGMALSGILIAPKVRAKGYATIVDPFQERYGARMGGLLFIPELFGDVFWEASILAALGSTLSVVLGINFELAVISSAVVAVVYTFFGGLYAVAYTDIIQLFFIFLGLILAIPFAYLNDAVDITTVKDTWLGEVTTAHIGLYIDTACMVVMGGMPWQAWYQRILACRTPQLAKTTTVTGAIIAVCLAIPPATVGVIGAATNWNITAYDGELPLSFTQWSMIFPMVLQYLCPMAVSIIGIGAIAAAVMSSADSCVLAAGSTFAKNVYSNIFRPHASDREIVWVLRLGIVITGALGAVIAICVGTVYGLFILCSDLMFVIQFPQLICVIFLTYSNTYGSFTGYVMGLFLRIAVGEPYLSIPALIKFPMYSEKEGQLFPVKTLSMLISLFSIIGVSYLTDRGFKNGKISLKYDYFKCFKEIKTEGGKTEIIANEQALHLQYRDGKQTVDKELDLIRESENEKEKLNGENSPSC